MESVVRAQSKLAAGLHDCLVWAAHRKRQRTSLPEEPQSRPEQQKNERDGERLSNDDVHVVFDLIPPD
jgi:hypothetical protein